MHLYPSQSTVRQPDRRYSFQLPPAAWTISFAEVTPDADSGTGCNNLNLGDPPDEFKFHWLWNHMDCRFVQQAQPAEQPHGSPAGAEQPEVVQPLVRDARRVARTMIRWIRIRCGSSSFCP